MKFQFPLVHMEAALDWLSGQFPGRREDIAKLAKGSPIGLEITARPIKSMHTKEQQGAYWASLHEFGRFLGYTAQETEDLLHPVICSAAFGVKDERRIVCAGREYTWPVPKETSSKDAGGRKRDIDTYSLLIDSLIRFAAEYGYVIEIKSPRAVSA